MSVVIYFDQFFSITYNHSLLCLWYDGPLLVKDSTESLPVLFRVLL